MRNVASSFQVSAIKRWAWYTVKASVVFLPVYVVSRYVSLSDPLLVAAFWALLTALAAAYPMLHRVMKKQMEAFCVHREHFSAKLVNGRGLCVVVSVVLGAVCTGALILDSQTWDVGEWLICFLVIPAFMLSYAVASRVLRGAGNDTFNGYVVYFGSFILTVIIVLVVALLYYFGFPTASYQNMAEACNGVGVAFGEADSYLLSDIGKVKMLSDAVLALGVSKLGEAFPWGYAVFRMFLVFGSVCAMASFCVACIMTRRDWTRLYSPLRYSNDEEDRDIVMKLPVGVTVLCLMCVMGLFAWAELEFREAAITEEYSIAERFVVAQVSLFAYEKDGVYYDKETVDDIVSSINERIDSFDRALSPGQEDDR